MAASYAIPRSHELVHLDGRLVVALGHARDDLRPRPHLHPDGAGAGLRSAEAAACVPVEQLEDVILPSRTLSATERLEIYRGMYPMRMVEVALPICASVTAVAPPAIPSIA